LLLLGLCPLLATTDALKAGSVMGLAALFVLAISGVVVSLIGRFIPKSIKTITYMTVSAVFVAVSELLISAFLPNTAAKIGIYLPLLAVSGITLATTEAADGKCVGSAAVLGISMGLGYFAVSLVLSFVRELLGRGSVFGIRILPEEFGAIVISAPAGALIVFGFLVAAFRFLVTYIEKRQEGQAEQKEGE